MSCRDHDTPLAVKTVFTENCASFQLCVVEISIFVKWSTNVVIEKQQKQQYFSDNNKGALSLLVQ